MKTKILFLVLVILSIVIAGYALKVKFSLAEPLSPEGGCQCDAIFLNKLDKILSNQAQILDRLNKLDRLVRTRSVD